VDLFLVMVVLSSSSNQIKVVVQAAAEAATNEGCMLHIF